MYRTRWLLAPLALLAIQPPLSAQFVGHRPGLHIEFGKVKKNGYFSLSYSRGPGYLGFNPYYYPPRGYSVTQLYLYSPPPPVIVQPPVIFQQPPAVPPELILPPFPERRAEQREEEPERPLPGRDVGGFRLLDPDNRDRARRPVPPMPDPPRPPDRPDVKDPPAPDPPMPPLPEANPRRESARQVELGKGAFARREYGLAAERFQRAVAAAPNEPEPHFLLGQTHLALGNYRRAYDALQTGLRLQPDWPMEAHRPIELYRDNVADYAASLEALEATLADHADDGVLLFLSGYALWFDGRREEARVLFGRARPALPDPGVVDRFLHALPGGDIL